MHQAGARKQPDAKSTWAPESEESPRHGLEVYIHDSIRVDQDFLDSREYVM
jgi:hypothetical protein